MFYWVLYFTPMYELRFNNFASVHQEEPKDDLKSESSSEASDHEDQVGETSYNEQTWKTYSF